MIWIFISCLLWTAQDRFDGGRFKGFTRSPTEHIIEQYEGIIEVRKFGGLVVVHDYPLEDAIVEIRGPGDQEAVRGVHTDKHGRFHFGALPEGSFAFKVTLNGFRPIVGKIQIKRSAKKRAPVHLEMLHGA